MFTFPTNPVLILDFGSQYTQLIARRVRELNVYCEIHPYNLDLVTFQNLAPCGVILSGGPASTITHLPLKIPEWLFTAEVPILGICYGMQAMALQLGGKVENATHREFGYAELKLHGHSNLLVNIEDRADAQAGSLLDVWMSHGDKVLSLPSGFKIICETVNTAIAGMADEQRHWYGLQFHPEVTHTTQGQRILQRFVVEICKASTQWTANNIINDTIDNIKREVGEEDVLLALSGGVDSSVVAVLLQKAIGTKLTCVFVDTGLLRLNEVEQIQLMFARHLGMNLRIVNAAEIFLTILDGVSCPEEKRRLIGHAFIKIFAEEANKLVNIKWLAQGTIYPDIIESAVGHGTSVTIKTHHNVGGLPESLPFKLLEPLRYLFKDEVRKIGLELGLPYDMVYRHPFPGPGLAVRILGALKPEYLTILRLADAIFIEELMSSGLYQEVSQAFAVFLPLKTVGVMGDARRYEYIICLRAVKTIDFMTAEWAQLPWEFLAKVSQRIINEVVGVARVAYDISGKPPATIEWE